MSRRRLVRLLPLAAALTAYVGTPAAQAAQPPAPAPDLSAPPLRTTPVAPTTLPTLWACHPDRTPNLCDEADGATTVLSNGAFQRRTVARLEPAPAAGATPPVDCFFAYGSVTGTASVDAPRRLDRDIIAAIQNYDTPFRRACRLFVPVYRQLSSLAGIGAAMARGVRTQTREMNIAYSDLLGAWRDYLAHDNHGRGVVFIGHSQGSAMLTRLIKEEVDLDAQRRGQFVGALLTGGNITVRRGQRNGGMFAYLPTCAEVDEYGCIVGFSSFASPPSNRTALFARISPLNQIYGGPLGHEYAVACTNPAILSGDEGRLRPLLHGTPAPGSNGESERGVWGFHRPTADTAWVAPGDRFTARCRPTETTNALMVRRASQASAVLLDHPWGDWGLHAGELGLTMGNLVRIVERQGAAWIADHPAATGATSAE